MCLPDRQPVITERVKVDHCYFYESLDRTCRSGPEAHPLPRTHLSNIEPEHLHPAANAVAASLPRGNSFIESQSREKHERLLDPQSFPIIGRKARNVLRMYMNHKAKLNPILKIDVGQLQTHFKALS